MYLTENDIRVIETVKTYGAASTTTLTNHIYNNYNVGTRRLKKLVDENYLNRERTSTGEWIYFTEGNDSHKRQQNQYTTECICSLISKGIEVKNVAHDKEIDGNNIQTLLGISYKDIKMILMIECNILDNFDIEKWEVFFEDKHYKKYLPIKPVVVLIDNKPIYKPKNFTMIRLNRDMSNVDILIKYIEKSLSKNKNENKNKDDKNNLDSGLVTSVPASKTVDIIKKYSIHACPNAARYEYDINLPITFRAKGGGMDCIYKIVDKLILNPLAQNYDSLDLEYRERVRGYIEERNAKYPFDEGIAEYIFYILSEDERIDLEHNPKPNTTNDVILHYYRKDDLCSGIRSIAKVTKEEREKSKVALD